MVGQRFAIIPARGGSKGLPNKNIRMLHSKPLIAWSILCAKAAKSIDRIVVSTDSEQIGTIAGEYGAEVIVRPESLASDSASTMDVLLHAIEVIGMNDDDVIVLMQPTSPLRTADDVDGAIELLRDEGSSVISVSEPLHSPYWSMIIKDNLLLPLMGKDAFNSRRQDLPPVYMPNGAVYVAMVETLIEKRTFYSNEIVPWIMPQERSIDIDSNIDLSLAEILMACGGWD